MVRVYIKNLNLHYGSKTVLKNLNWVIAPGDCWILSGQSGSGKTVLASSIAHATHFTGEITFHYDKKSHLPSLNLFVADHYQFTNLEGDKNFYYQQRYNYKQSKDTLTVGAELQQYGLAHKLNTAVLAPIKEALNFCHAHDTQLIELSGGEHKKLQLVKALWLKPQLLIIDQPYIGLDACCRANLNILLAQLNQEGVTLILITNNYDLPKINLRFAAIEQQQIVEKTLPTRTEIGQASLLALPRFLSEKPNYSASQIVEMKGVNVRYGHKQVLKNINWEVKAGQRWLLQGRNGSGKSTLLSLLNGDHPQAYGNDIYLFGNKTGCGESIWEIKKRVGLITPEMHWYFDGSYTVWQSIASGLFDSVGLFQQPSYAQKQKVNELVCLFGLKAVKNEKLQTLPLGKQKLTLLARAIIKNPALLILDEPCQGLDQQQIRYFNQLVDQISAHGLTLIYVNHFETDLPNCINYRLVLDKGEIKINEHIQTALEEFA